MAVLRIEKERMKKIWDFFNNEEHVKLYLFWSQLANQRRNLAEKMRKNIECEKEFNRWTEDNNRIYSQITKKDEFDKLVEVVKKLASIELNCELKEIRDSNKAFQIWKKTKGKEVWSQLEKVKIKNMELYDKFCSFYQIELKDKIKSG